MSGWWRGRLIWLGLGLLIGLMGMLPDGAGGAVTIIFIVLVLVYTAALGTLLTRWAKLAPGMEMRGKGAAPVRHNLYWDTVLFLGATVLCSYLSHLAF